MKIPLLVGIFFLVLAAVFGASAARAASAAEPGRAISSLAHRRMAVIFAIVGIGLIVFSFVGH